MADDMDGAWTDCSVAVVEECIQRSMDIFDAMFIEK